MKWPRMMGFAQKAPERTVDAKKAMLRAGRDYLNAHVKESANSYELKQRLAIVAPSHSAVEQSQVLDTLRREFAKRGK